MFGVVHEHVTRLAVGVVGENVEQGDLTKAIVQVFPRLEEREVMLLEVGVDEQLQRAFAHWPVSQQRDGHKIKAHRHSQAVRGYLASMQPGSEVPQWSLAAQRFVDGAHTEIVGRHLHQERRVAAVRHAHLDGDLSSREHVGRRGVVGRHQPRVSSFEGMRDRRDSPGGRKTRKVVARRARVVRRCRRTTRPEPE